MGGPSESFPVLKRVPVCRPFTGLRSGSGPPGRLGLRKPNNPLLSFLGVGRGGQKGAGDFDWDDHLFMWKERLHDSGTFILI